MPDGEDKSADVRRSRGWCFTINNPTGWDDADLETLRREALYCICGREKGSEGTFHYQGYVRFKNAKTFTRIKKFLPRAHIERQRGTCSQASEYCKKDGDFNESGVLPADTPGESTKNRWKEVIQLSRDGKMQEIEDNHPHLFFMYKRRINELRRREPKILDELDNEWWWGETGTGKSKKLWEDYPIHYQKSHNKWWDGYADQEVVAIEEFHPEAAKYLGSFIKQWADRYPFSPEVKGGRLELIRPKKIIIISNFSMEQCFEKHQDLLPLLRRFKVTEFKSL
nr:rep protein [Cressdnaviricota sp.]UOF81641.1 rep protein [Cressdnaviricota sp.]UOF82348.1 rep protein [Cressdnaviricota sp.]